MPPGPRTYMSRPAPRRACARWWPWIRSRGSETPAASCPSRARSTGSRHEAQHLGPAGSQERLKNQRADRHGSRGVAGFALRHLEFGDIRDVFNRRGVALASEKAREHLPALKTSHNASSFAHDESTSHRNERLMPDHTPGNGKTFRQAVGKAAIGFQTALCPTSFCLGASRRHTGTEAHSREKSSAIRGGGHGSLLG